MRKSPIKSDLEAEFLFYCKTIAPDLPEPIPQFEFDPRRQWRLDFAWPALKIGVELDGGAGGGFGRPVICHVCHTPVRAMKANGQPGKQLRIPAPSHGSGAGMDRDREKRNALTLAGWYLFSYTSLQLKADPGAVIDQLKSFYNQRSPSDTPLTDRETSVIALIAAGETIEAAAIALNISARTVVDHLQSIRRKLNVPSTAAAIALAIKQGYLIV